MSEAPQQPEWIPAPEVPPLLGGERFVGISATVADFWGFAMQDVSAWEFFVIPRSKLIELGVDSIGRSTAARLSPSPRFDQLTEAISNAAAPASSSAGDDPHRAT